MVLQPVLMPIPEDDSLKAPEKVARQREYARRALVECARRCGAPTEGWEQDANRIPKPNQGFCWSISHKPRLAAAVISDQPAGIDVEYIKPRSQTGLWDRLAGEDEWGLAGERNWEMFFRIWTAKEAILKANSRGISGLSDCRVVEVRNERHMRLNFEGRSWEVEHHALEDHLAAVTVGQERVIWTVLRSDSCQPL